MLRSRWLTALFLESDMWGRGMGIASLLGCRLSGTEIVLLLGLPTFWQVI
jgi:hypothetical protein